MGLLRPGPLLRAMLVLLVVAHPAGSLLAQPQARIETVHGAICRLIEGAARADRLPVEFMTRLIWRESSFRASAVSPAGARGIAQFMPGTARERGLANPFDPEQAIPKAARLIVELRRRFGNLGIAAAAYNAGPARVADWLRGEGELPAETRAYVRFITDRAVEAWIGSGSSAGSDASSGMSESGEAGICLATVAMLRRSRGPGADDEDGPGFAPLAPWGVQLAGNFSKAVALASFERTRQRYAAVIGDLRPMVIGRVLRSRGTRRFYQVRLPAQSRREATALCARIRSAGGICVAMPS